MINKWSKKDFSIGIEKIRKKCDILNSKIKKTKENEIKMVKLEPININILDKLYKKYNRKKIKKRFNWKQYNYLNLDDYKEKVIIYLIFTNNFPYNKKKLNEKIENLPNNIAFSRVNKDKNALNIKQKNKWNKLKKGQSYCLYVGSSKDFPTRLKEHLGYGSTSTYSLQLKKWWLLNTEILINIWDITKLVGSKLDEQQMIEDIIWDKFIPLFGRKGGK